MFVYHPEKRIIIITGHYGSGKTNIAVNLALSFAAQGKKTTLVDLDIVNPYFRAADSKKILTDAGIKCIIPEYANSNVDVPSLPPEIYSVFADTESITVFDVGGDDTGAVALGMFSQQIQNCGYEMLYTVSMYRPLTAEPSDAVDLMHDIEARSRLRCTGIINNSNIGAESTDVTFEASFEYADEISRLTSLPVVFSSSCINKDYQKENIFIISDYTKKLYGG